MLYRRKRRHSKYHQLTRPGGLDALLLSEGNTAAASHLVMVQSSSYNECIECNGRRFQWPC